jgi:hypothetical protein
MKTVIASFRELGLSYKEFCSILKSAGSEVRPLKRLVGNPFKESMDSWLIRAGITLIAFPDPTITDLIGSAMVAAGLIKRRLKQPTMADAYVAFTDTVKSLERIRQDLRY